MSDPQFEYFHLIGQVVRNFFVKLITKPFSFLASVIGSDSGTDEMGSIRFLPGKMDLSQEELAKIKILVAGLKERPKLLLQINGSYDPDIDWKAIKTEVFKKEYDGLVKESTRAEDWVYRELYERRFGVRDLWALTKKYKGRTDAAAETELKEEIKRQLIENASADKVALDVLATARAKIVYDAMITEGFETDRVSIGQSRKVQGSMGFVPLEFTLTIFGESDQPAAESTLVDGVSTIPVSQ